MPSRLTVQCTPTKLAIIAKLLINYDISCNIQLASLQVTVQQKHVTSTQRRTYC